MVQECEDGGTEGSVPGVKIAGLQDDFRFRVCGDELGCEIDAGIVRYGLVEEERSRTASLGERSGDLESRYLILPGNLLRVHPSLLG